MKILVTGGTGFIGAALVKKLCQKGHEVVILTRNSFSAYSNIPVYCEVREWDPGKYLCPSVFHGVDAVINLAGENIADGWWTKKRKFKISNSRTLAIKTLKNSIELLTVKPKAFISASAIGYFGESGEKITDEDTNPGEGFLAQVCQNWEYEIFKINRLGVRTIALRIGLVLGRDGGALKKMLSPFRMGLGGKLGKGKQWISWIHIEDLVNMFIHTIENNSMNGVYNAVAPNPVTNSTFTKTLGKVLNKPTFLSIPTFALKFILGELSDLLLTSQRVTSNKIHNHSFHFQYPKLEEALENISSNFDHEFQMEQWVPHPPKKAFDFFKEARNLEKITPDFLNFKVLNQSTANIEEGTKINYRFTLHGIPMWWQSKIIDWKPPFKFSDYQVHGPYSKWLHTHEFEEVNGGTLMRDRVVYRLPLGIPGDAIAEPLVKKDIRKIFSHRRKVIESLME
tara:strand:+ start:951 stop:2309 length:1359 start_codon:yes stop_codon:yes gene_type:complete